MISLPVRSNGKVIPARSMNNPNDQKIFSVETMRNIPGNAKKRLLESLNVANVVGFPGFILTRPN